MWLKTTFGHQSPRDFTRDYTSEAGLIRIKEEKRRKTVFKEMNCFYSNKLLGSFLTNIISHLSSRALVFLALPFCCILIYVFEPDCWLLYSLCSLKSGTTHVELSSDSSQWQDRAMRPQNRSYDYLFFISILCDI